MPRTVSENPKRLRVMTWNIHGCVGSDGRHDVARVGRAIDAIAPDIAALQEVDSRRQSPAHPDIYTYLRSQVGDHGHEAWSITGADGNYGQMIASRYALSDRHIHDISMPRREPRNVMEVRVRLPSIAFRVLATHLGVRRRERRRQIARILEIIAEDPSPPLILLGDLNEWNPAGPAWRSLSRLFGDASRRRSFPARVPALALDRILIRPEGLATRFWTANGARMASDHLPVVTELDLSRFPAPPVSGV